MLVATVPPKSAAANVHSNVVKQTLWFSLMVVGHSINIGQSQPVDRGESLHTVAD